MDYSMLGSVALRSLLAVIALFIISRVTGARQISQLTFYEYVVGISIGSIAAIGVDTDIPLIHIVVSMLVFGGFSWLLTFISLKSLFLRRLLGGKPKIIISNGKIIRKNLSKSGYDINELLLDCRLKGYYNIEEIAFAVMETNGQLSILPRAQYKPLTPDDMAVQVAQQSPDICLVLDGKLLQDNLRHYGKHERWLREQMKKQGAADVTEALLCLGHGDDTISVYLKNEQLKNNHFFM